MVSIRSKMILSLIGMSLFAIALTVCSARIIMLKRFDNFIVETTSIGFLREVVEYYRVYGSWEAATEAEPFIDFMMRMAPHSGMNKPPPGASDTAPPDHHLRLPYGGDAPTFAATDLTGKVWVPNLVVSLGETIQESKLKTGMKIMDGNQHIGYGFSADRMALSDLEERYLLALNDSWWWSICIVLSLAIPVGYFLGFRLSAPINRLSDAIRAMRPGAIVQNVSVTSKDELGQLSASFNQMSLDLSSAYADLEKSRKKLEELSLEDSLTSLPNRRAFDNASTLLLTRAKRDDRPSVLAIVDIDHFKLINDNFSHLAGDKVLQQFAIVLRENLREVDFVARYGGEEFIVLFPETDLSAAKILAERLRQRSEDYNWDNIDPKINLTISIGLVELASSDETGLNNALKEADKKLYQAKSSGRNRIVV